MDVITGLFGIGIAKKAIDKIGETVSDVSHERTKRKRYKAKMKARSKRDEAKEKTRREVEIARIKAEGKLSTEHKQQSDEKTVERRKGFFGSLYASKDNNKSKKKDEMFFCPKCGKGPFSGAIYCKFCGSKIQ